jgi:hypothetical protein
MTHAVLLGGLFIGVLSALPIINVANCCCVWIVGGGMLTAYLTQLNESRPITPGRGAGAGLLAGIVGALVWLIVAVMLDAVLAPIQQRVVEEALSNAQDMPPGAREWMQLFAGRNSAPLRHALGFGFHLFGAAFAALGGLLGAVFFRSKTSPPPPAGLSSPPPFPPALPPE